MNSGVQRGFSLYELLITVLVAGVILGLGIPNLAEFVRTGRMAAATNDYVSGVHRARSESVTRSAPVTLCTSANPLAPLPACNPETVLSDGGFFAWVDTDADAVADAGEEILLQHGGSDGIAVVADSGYLHFEPSGFVTEIGSVGSAASVMLFCDSRGNVRASGQDSAARAVRLPPTGRPALLRQVDEIALLPVACP